jgi:hypothetical protein
MNVDPFTTKSFVSKYIFHEKYLFSRHLKIFQGGKEI